MSDSQMVVCRGFAILSDGLKVAIYSVPTLAVISAPKTVKVSLPMASDGQYVYSLSTRYPQIAVFAVTLKGELIEQSGRQVTLKAGPNMDASFFFGFDSER
jgi:hypothetical protein